jgi:ribosome biogenesis GTPase A
MASTNPLTKVARQHETTWTQLHKRIADIPFQFEEIFLPHKAVSLNSSIGYLIPSLLTSTAFLSAKNGCTVQTLTHEQPINMYTIFVGYPGSGKSSAIQYGCLQPIADLE